MKMKTKPTVSLFQAFEWVYVIAQAIELKVVKEKAENFNPSNRKLLN
jgi:hypothetical protein